MNLVKKLVIAIDGPSGAGKGTLARTVAERLLATDPAAAERHVARWLGGRVVFLNA